MRYIRHSGLATSACGQSIDGYSSRCLEQLRSDGACPILVVGGVHGDEPEGVRLAQDLLDELTTGGFAADASRVCDWVVVPCLNVDGFAERTRVNGRGVDLNRNYPSPDWSPRYTNSRYHPGLFPASEPETQLMVRLLTTLRPRLVIHCHSWHPCVVATGALAQRDGERLARSSGYQLTPEIGYPTPGSLSRYGWHHLGLPVICIEEQEHLSDLNQIWARFRVGFREIFLDRDARGRPSDPSL